MPTAQPADEARIREQAYYFWEQDGRPDGRETEYWQRATVAVTGKAQMDTLTKLPPKKAAKPKAEPAKIKAESKPKVAPKLRAAASKAKSVPAKSGKPDPDKKPKKK